MRPKRIQRRRTKGWRMPPGVVYVGRPSPWGNRFKVVEYGPGLALRNFRRYVVGRLAVEPDWLEPLRGKTLACWCPVGEPCHADTLLEFANMSKKTEPKKTNADTQRQIAVSKIQTAISEAIAPPMTKEEAILVCNSIEGFCQSQAHAIQDDIDMEDE